MKDGDKKEEASGTVERHHVGCLGLVRTGRGSPEQSSDKGNSSSSADERIF